MKNVIYVLPLLAAAALSLPAAAQTATASSPVRHLVYSFTYASAGDLQTHGTNGYAQDTHSGAGYSRDYTGNVQDKGTITVDVVREQPDKGLVVKISEQAEQTRRANVATCVVYGNTTIICDPNATINSEELTLMRFLGTTFVDLTQIDDKQHWKVDQSNSVVNTVADYTIGKNAGGVLTIDENRVITDRSGAIPVTTDVNSTIGYDFNRLLPTSVQEFATRRQGAGAGNMMTTTVQTTLNLVSDSMAKN